MLLIGVIQPDGEKNIMSAATDSKDPKTLEREAEVKRANLNRTLNEVEQRFSPNHLMEQTVEYFGEHGSDIAQSVGRSIKENPLPLLLTGVGIAWLISSQSRGSVNRYPGSRYRDSLTQWDERGSQFDKARSAYARTNRPIGDLPSASGHNDDYYPDSDSDDDSLSDSAGQMLDSAKQSVQTMADKTSQWRDELDGKLKSLKQGAEESADDFRERVIFTSVEHAESMEYQYQQAQQTAQHLYMRGRQQAQAAADASQQMLSRGRKHAQSATETARNFMQEQPLVAGALGIAAGALLGALLPSTRTEDELVGSHADSIKLAATQRAASVSEMAASKVSDSAQTFREKGEQTLDKIESEDKQVTPV